jgi:Xaa-Pro aminopeptidase
MNTDIIQQYLQEHEIDGWLMADFHGRNTVALGIWNITDTLTRRTFVWIPASGQPVALVHRIEASKFSALPVRFIPFSGYQQLESELADLLKGCGRIAMEYSPMGRLPYVGLVEAGTIELIRSFDIEIVSSADMVARFLAALSVEQIATARMAAHNLYEIKDAAFALISKALADNSPITEYDVHRFILDKFEEYDMTTAFGPNCSVGAHAGDPHYEPTEEDSATIERGQIVLIDLWGKLKHEHGVYADITWMAFAGTAGEIPEEYSRLFSIVIKARDTAVQFLRDNIDKRPVAGYEVDDACRAVFAEAGLADHFIHRTGHSIAADEHGPGPNIDNLETEDRRKLQRGHLFSIEPGLYFDDFGMRSEIDVLIGRDGVEILTLPLQTTIQPLL